jgi:hypothetical protein
MDKTISVKMSPMPSAGVFFNVFDIRPDGLAWRNGTACQRRASPVYPYVEATSVPAIDGSRIEIRLIDAPAFVSVPGENSAPKRAETVRQ